ncbi:protein ripply2 [Puntigrus tetrazona]|uniref:protein ripply2 n=1 Tax=Puntigrus tetrazona TaxID=1606681 RepID=UPI001C8AC223|nr:protein ripply2 [Puntigrus tetrazona]
MEKLSHRLASESDATRPWRPWTRSSGRARNTGAHEPYKRASAEEHHSKASLISHPVKLFWPRSRCFDYLYRDAEILLRSYPVQATICLYEDSDSDDDEEDRDEEHEKELN